jgi:hypothetical protein
VNEDNDCLPVYDHNVNVCYTQKLVTYKQKHEKPMIDTNNDNITKNQTFIHQMLNNDDTDMINNDFDRYNSSVEFFVSIDV